MSEHQLQTYTERARDQRRIEALEGQLRDAYSRLAWADKRHGELARAYRDALDALATAGIWRGVAFLVLTMAALTTLLRWMTP